MYKAYDEWKLRNPNDVGTGSWFAFRAGWLACKNAQQSVHPNGGSLPPSQAESTLEVNPLAEADTNPPAIG